MSLTDIVKKTIVGISLVAVATIGGCEKGTVKIENYDFNGDRKVDRVLTWYDEKGNKTKQTIRLGGSTPIWVDKYSKGYKSERTFDNNGDGNIEGRFSYDSTGEMTSCTWYDAYGKPGRIPKPDSNIKK